MDTALISWELQPRVEIMESRDHSEAVKEAKSVIGGDTCLYEVFGQTLLRSLHLSIFLN